jgi:hypothetical protein
MIKRYHVPKYQPLETYLAARSGTIYNITFGDIEEVLSAPLPPSARKHQAWWSNEINGSHVHAKAWMNTGFRSENLNIEANTVTFKFIGR